MKKVIIECRTSSADGTDFKNSTTNHVLIELPNKEQNVQAKGIV